MAVSELTAKIILGDKVNLGLNLKNRDNDTLKEAKFSKPLLHACFRVFDKFRDHFEIKERIYLSDAERRVIQYNENVEKFNNDIAPVTGEPNKKKILTGKIRGILALLETNSLDELVKKKIICRTTAHYYQKKFDTLGINFHTGSTEFIPNCRSFKEYHQSLFLAGMMPYLDNNIFF